MSEDIKNLSEIIELCQDELNKSDENITAILDLQDLKSLKNIINDYKRQLEINQEHQKVNGELRQKIKELEDADLTTIYLNGVYDERSKWKQKIKEKIEELCKEIDKAIDNSKGGLDEEFIDKGTKLLEKKQVLQELLERG